jgi:hypothetical protein
MSEHHSQCDIECSIGIGMFYVFAMYKNAVELRNAIIKSYDTP